MTSELQPKSDVNSTTTTGINGWKALRGRYDSDTVSTPASSESLVTPTAIFPKGEAIDLVSEVPVRTNSTPSFTVPYSAATVDVRIIDTTSYLKSNSSLLLKPSIAGHTIMAMTSYSFLIRHSASATNLLFDLGIRKDWDASLPPILRPLVGSSANGGSPLHVHVERDVRDILDDDECSVGIKAADIHAVIWSHAHFDHRGDISRFGPAMTLIVGPETLNTCLPGYPTCAESDFLESDLEGRRIREMRLEDFDLHIGGFRAYDAFGDGSFYLLHCPGHSEGHMGALARTSPPSATSESTFVFLAADCAHHCAEFRPSVYVPLPRSMSLGPVYSKFSNDLKPRPPKLETAPSAIYKGYDIQAKLHPHAVANKPFYEPPREPTCYHQDEAGETLRKLQLFDAQDNVLVCLSHDPTLRSILPLFPAKVNEWHKRGYKDQLRWEFLRDFDLSDCVDG